MTNEFPVIIVTEEAYEGSENEALGSKYKFWFQHEKLGRCLYKQTRANSGEDWAEKIASELCAMLGLPHAIKDIFNLIPRDRISPIAADYAQKIIKINKHKLLNLRG